MKKLFLGLGAVAAVVTPVVAVVSCGKTEDGVKLEVKQGATNAEIQVILTGTGTKVKFETVVDEILKASNIETATKITFVNGAVKGDDITVTLKAGKQTVDTIKAAFAPATMNGSDAARAILEACVEQPTK